MAGCRDQAGQPAGHGLEDGHAEAFAVARQDEGVGRCPDLAGALAGDVAEVRHAPGQAELGHPVAERRQGAVVVAGDHEVELRKSGARSGRRASASKSRPFFTCTRAKKSRTNLPTSSGYCASSSARGGKSSNGARSTPLGTKQIGVQGAMLPQVVDLRA